MIDIATVEEYMRAANPIPTLDALDADELAFAVAAVDTRRAAAMQAPTQHPTPTSPPTTPPPRRHQAWAFAAAFVLILVVVGAAALVLRSDDGAPPADEPSPAPAVVETPTTLAAAPPPKGILDDTGKWQATQLSEPWTGDIVDVVSLPSGGFVVAARSGVFWSPDGVEWIDADPDTQVTAATPGFVGHGYDLPQVISVMGDRVVVLDGIDPGLWVGNPRAGEWESLRFDTADLAGHVQPYAVASNDTEVLVLAEHHPNFMQEDIETVSQRAEFQSADKGYLVWLANPGTGEVERHPLPPTPELPEAGGLVAWVNNRWLVALDDAILVSGDGATWTQVPDEDTFDNPVWVTALAAGPTGVVAATCEGWGNRYVYFSEDGLKWENTYVQNNHEEPAYADGLGFVVVDGGEGGSEEEGHWVTGSPDGRTWHAKTWHSGGVPSWALADDGALNGFEIQNVAAFGQTVFVDHTFGALLLTYE
jgi:hypothetical protein